MAEPSANPGYSDDGVDVTLIRWFLKLTPVERLRYVSNSAAEILRIRAARGIDPQ